MRSYTVYKHTSPTGKVYIGITSNTLQRRWKGGHGYETNTHFMRAIKRHGWGAFQHETLFSNLTEEEAKAKEQELITLYDSTNPNKGYNRDLGGNVRSRETAAKISAALTGVPHSDERRKRQSKRQQGRKLSEVCKRKLSEGHKRNPKVIEHIINLNKERAGKAKTEEHRHKIAESQPRRRAVINLDTGQEYASVHDAAKACSGAHPGIVKACTGERPRAYGFRWAYKEGATV